MPEVLVGGPVAHRNQGGAVEADGPLAHQVVVVRGPADGIAAALLWSAPRLDAALDHARAHPDAGGAPALRDVPPDGYTAVPRLDVLRPDQADVIAGRKNPPSVRGCIQPIEAEVLLGSGSTPASTL
ncbi:hypothetical protein ACH4FX_42130 [Streptomyces sp. NPDC018019]|uniref:hypothetical protein n=1 Tax=Streptomyces sp. NPDC018019 TaxID=3365030 RepID=UPI0037BADEDF